MMTDNLLDQGVALMIYGMGTVYMFLSLLIATTHVMSWAVQRFFPEAQEILKPAQAVPQQQNKPPIAVITAALHRYRSKHINKPLP